MEKINRKNVVILIILLILIIIGVRIFNNSKANKQIEITANFKDFNKLASNETATIVATDDGKNGTAVILPEYANEKKISKYIIIKKSIIDENSDTSTQRKNETLENTAVENKVVNETFENMVAKNTTVNETLENITVVNTTVNETATNVAVTNEIVTNTTTKTESLTAEKLPGETIYLTQEELENKLIEFEVVYDTVEVDSELLYNKKVTYEEDVFSIIGYMPEKTKINVTETDISNIEEEIANNYSQMDIVRKL